MPISHEAAVARARKAAATRARNKALGRHTFGPVPSYSAKSEQRHNIKVHPPKPRKLVSIRGIRKASTEELQADYEYMNRPHRDTGLKDTLANERRYYAIKDELRARANPNLALFENREGLRTIAGKKVTRKSQKKRVTGAQPRPKRTGTGKRKSRQELYGF